MYYRCSSGYVGFCAMGAVKPFTKLYEIKFLRTDFSLLFIRVTLDDDIIQQSSSASVSCKSVEFKQACDTEEENNAEMLQRYYSRIYMQYIYTHCCLKPYAYFILPMIPVIFSPFIMLPLPLAQKLFSQRDGTKCMRIPGFHFESVTQAITKT